MTDLPRKDPEFQMLVPPLTQEEREQLEKNIVEHKKCINPLVSWDGLLIDGYNRLDICIKNGIAFEVKEMEFSTRDEAKIWILDNQLGRRNLSDAARIEIAALRAEMLKAKAKDKQKAAGGDKYGKETLFSIMTTNSEEPINLHKQIAAEASISEGTLHMYNKIKKEGSPELLQSVLCGEVKIGTAYKSLKSRADTNAEKIGYYLKRLEYSIGEIKKQINTFGVSSFPENAEELKARLGAIWAVLDSLIKK
ncbi:MAG: hypothetical protein FWE82_01610 [Defluviitaleaceae bacterium]|nr:hypothetical protein [Defluviitaleaceae bacterium]